MRNLLLVALALLVTLVAGLAAFLFTLDVQRYKPQLVAAVGQALGRPVEVRGEIAFTPAWLPTLAVQDVHIGATGWVSPTPLVVVERAEATVDLRALLDRRVEVTRVHLAGVRIELARDADGRGNWETAPAAASAAAEAPPAPGAPAPTAPGWPAPVLHEVLLEKITLTYSAHQAPPQALEVERLALLAGATPADPQRVDGRLVLGERAVEVSGTIAPFSAWLGTAPVALDLAVTSGGARLALRGTLGLVPGPVTVQLELDAGLPADDPLASAAGAAGRLLPVALEGHLANGKAADSWQLSGFELVTAQGPLRGTLTLTTGGPRPSLAGNLAAARFDLRPWQPAPKAGDDGGPLFDDTPLALGALRRVDLELALAVGALETRQARIDDLSASLSLAAGRLQVPKLTGTMDGGRLRAALELDLRGDVPALEHALFLQGLALERYVAPRGGHGGSATVDLAVTASGRTPAALAASARGHVRLDARDIVLEHSGNSLGAATTDLLLQLVNVLNPLASRDPRTRIECAVVNFPLQDGVLKAAQGLAVRTDKLNILGGGTVELASEKIDLGVNPKPREGIGLNLAGLADFVRIGGTLRTPRPVTDGVGAASAGLKVGAAFATGGLSVLAEGLLDRSEGDVDVCGVARGTVTLQAPAKAVSTTAAGATTPTPADSSTNPVGRAASAAGRTLKDAGGAIKGVFKGLFGR